MSRPSKYRVFASGEMYYPGDKAFALTMHGDLIHNSTDNMQDGFAWARIGFNDIHVSWFTGLLDSEGAEIYEGDYVDARTPAFYDELVRYLIVFDDESASFMCEHAKFIEVDRYEPESNKGKERWRLDSFSEITVIGNCCENQFLPKGG